MTEENQDTVRKAFTLRYLSALCLVGALSTSAFIILSSLLQTQSGDATVINVAGRQRMLSQRVSLMGSKMVNATVDTEREHLRGLMKDAIGTMRKSHQALIRGDEKMGIDGKLSPALQEQYFGEHALDRQVETYLERATKLSNAPAWELRPDNLDLAYLTSQATKPLLQDLNAAVKIYETESQARTKSLHNIEVGLWLVTLLLLLVEGVFIFRPIVKRLGLQMRQMREDAEKLRDKDRRIGLLLDATRDGLLPVDLEGNITVGASHCLDGWFGEPKVGTPFWDYLSERMPPQSGNGRIGHDELRATLQLGFEQIIDDYLPFELCRDQMIHRLFLDGAAEGGGDVIYDLDYREILENERRVGFLLVIRDVTVEVQREKAQAAARELHGILGHLLRDRSGFIDFMKETERQLALYVEAARGWRGTHPNSLSAEEGARLLHTVKGNTAIFGFTEFASKVHGVETEIAQGGDPLILSERLQKEWADASERLDEWIASDDENLIGLWLSEAEYKQHLRRLERGQSPKAILPAVRSWRDEPVRRRMDRLASAARGVAERLGKDVKVEVEDPMLLRLPSGDFGPIWDALVHLVRNAIDHGIESPEVRAMTGKPERGVLKLSCKVLSKTKAPVVPTPSMAPLTSMVPPDLTDGIVEIAVADDGAGIDWERVAEKARAHGLAWTEQSDLVEALFADGVSTKEEVTEVSGRGVGLSALYALVQARNGEIAVDSRKDRGTTFRVHVPMLGEA